jgi:hypothetical protein
MLITSLIKGNGYGSFLVTTLSFLKSTQILSFPFFLSTATMSDNKIGSSINLIKPTASNLSISYLTMVASLGFNKYLT